MGTRPRGLAVLLLLALVSPGCSLVFGGPAAIYHHTVEPLDLNATGLELGQAHKSRSTVRIEPYSYLVVEAGNRGIGEIARRYGFLTVDHADLEILSVMGVYTQRFVHVYGTRALPVEDQGDEPLAAGGEGQPAAVSP